MFWINDLNKTFNNTHTNHTSVGDPVDIDKMSDVDDGWAAWRVLIVGLGLSIVRLTNR